MRLLSRRRDDAARPATLDGTTAPEGHDEVALLRAALDALDIGVIVVDRTGVVRARNSAAQRVGGAAHGDVLVREAIDKHVARALAGDESSSTVELFGPPRRVLHVRAAPVTGGGAIVSVDDVSERARLDSVRTDFVANISHELKTPVGALAVLTEAIVGEDDPDVVRRLATKASDEAHRAAGAIDDLLELSRIELGGRGEKEPVDVDQLLADVLDRVGPTADQRGTTIHVGRPAARVTLHGDPRQLVSALTNLVDNAVKYSDVGSEIDVVAEEERGAVVFTVRDHGIGIPARDLDRIFERFYRVDRARSRETGGTGLGLAIVRHVVTNHDGEISVRSAEGEGTTFTMRIPL